MGKSPPPGFTNKQDRPATFQWDKVGAEFTGHFLGLVRVGKGDRAFEVADLVTLEGVPLRASAPAILADLLRPIRAGTKVWIHFEREEPAKEKGRNPLKFFEVFTAD